MKYRVLALMGIMALSAGSLVLAQDYDDIYYDGSETTTIVKTTDAPRAQARQASIVYSEVPTKYKVAVKKNYKATRDVDEYNRRGAYEYDYSDYDSDTIYEESFANTRRIERFYNPDIVVLSDDDELVELYYDDSPTINLVIGSSWSYPGYGLGWYSNYNPWYYSWRYSSWWPYDWGWDWGWSYSIYRPWHWWGWGYSWYDPIYWGYGGWHPGWHGWDHHRWGGHYAWHHPGGNRPHHDFRPHGRGTHRDGMAYRGNRGGNQKGVNLGHRNGRPGGLAVGDRRSGRGSSHVGTASNARTSRGYASANSGNMSRRNNAGITRGYNGSSRSASGRTFHSSGNRGGHVSGGYSNGGSRNYGGSMSRGSSSHSGSYSSGGGSRGGFSGGGSHGGGGHSGGGSHRR